VKLAFMLSRELEAPRTGVYEFVPYRRGPLSFTLYYDLRTLRQEGWIDELEHDVRLARGRSPADIVVAGARGVVAGASKVVTETARSWAA
jgi:hypothetical protein